MKFAFLFLICASIFIVATHQYFHDHQPREMPWMMQYSPHPIIDKYHQQPFIFYYANKPRMTPEIYSSQNENVPRDWPMPSDDNHQFQLKVDQRYIFPDTQSRVKNLNHRNPSLSANLNEQEANGRFLYNLFASSGTYTNPFFKTATFTSTTSVSLTSYVTCVPSFQMANAAAAVACRRKRTVIDDDNVSALSSISKYQQPIIAPSETEKLIPTAFLSLPQSYEQLPLSSSKTDDDELTTSTDVTTMTDRRQLFNKEKRFVFGNYKNQFLVSSTTTAFSFLNTTVTVTRNLINPPPGVQCKAQQAAGGAAAQGDYLCVACLPPGYVVCAASG